MIKLRDGDDSNRTKEGKMGISDRELKREYEYVRETFFPKWDRKHQWRIKRVWHLPLPAKYDDEAKKILIQSIPEARDGLHTLLIHEISHCVGRHHGKRFRNRLSRAKDKAEIIGRKTLAEKIGEGLSILEDPTPPYNRVPDVYKRIYDKVFMSDRKISWPRLLREVSWDTGMYPKEFLKRFKRAQKTFLSAKRDAKDNEEATRKSENLPENLDKNKQN